RSDEFFDGPGSDSTRTRLTGRLPDMTNHSVGTREEWLAARIELLAEEKELTRRSDELARTRQALPWVAVDEDYGFETEEGTKTLVDMFDGRSQLLVYHFMFGPTVEGWPDAGCPGCSYTADSLDGAVVHLPPRGVTFVAVSRAQLENLQVYRRRMGWSFPWGSAAGSDFNLDFAVFTEEGRKTGTGFNFGTPKHASEIDLRRDELHGLSAFALEDGIVYHTYSFYDRGTDALTATWQLLLYHFMFGPNRDAGCDGCSMFVDQIGHLAHLHVRDTSFGLVSRAPLAKITAYKKRMGWTIPWYSSIESDFNVDFGVSPETPQPDVYQDGESFGLSVFLHDGDEVFRSYFTTHRGVEALGSVWTFLDLTPLGRQEEWEDSPAGYPQTKPYAWWHRHDEYEDAGADPAA